MLKYFIQLENDHTVPKGTPGHGFDGFLDISGNDDSFLKIKHRHLYSCKPQPPNLERIPIRYGSFCIGISIMQVLIVTSGLGYSRLQRT
jgi:hypothetical protein